MRIALGTLLVFSLLNVAQAQLKIGLTAFPQTTTSGGLIPFKKEVTNNVNLPTMNGGFGLIAAYDSYYKPWGAMLSITYNKHAQNYLYNYSLNGDKFTHRGKRRFNYLHFSLMARRFGYIGKYAKSVVFIGPQVSYMLSYTGGALVYDEDRYFDLPPATPAYYKKINVDAVLGYGIDYAIHKNFDVFAYARLYYGLTNAAVMSSSYNGVKLFEGSGVHHIGLGLMLGGYYVFNRKDHLLLPGNTWRFRVYKKKTYKKKR